MKQLTLIRRIQLFALMFILLFAVLEGMSRLGLWLLEKRMNVTYTPLELKPLSSRYQEAIKRIVAGDSPAFSFSSSLGWEPRPNASELNGTLVNNSIGARHTREFSEQPPEGITRVSTYGESFTQSATSNDGTWQELLMRMDPELEVINFGVSGYGTGQAYLRYLEKSLPSDIVILGYMTENLNRVVNTYVPFYGGDMAGAPVTKPRLALRKGKLAVVPNPMQDRKEYLDLISDPRNTLIRLGQNDYYYNSKYKRGFLDFLGMVRLGKIAYYTFKKNPTYKKNGEYNTESEAFQVTTAIFEAFYKDVLQKGMLPVILIYPTYDDLAYYYLHKKRKYRPLTDWLKEKNYLYLDLLEGMSTQLEGRAIKDIFRIDLHYTPEGNEMVAKTLQSFIAANGLKDKASRISLVERERKRVSAEVGVQ